MRVLVCINIAPKTETKVKPHFTLKTPKMTTCHFLHKLFQYRIIHDEITTRQCLEDTFFRLQFKQVFNDLFVFCSKTIISCVEKQRFIHSVVIASLMMMLAVPT